MRPPSLRFAVATNLSRWSLRENLNGPPSTLLNGWRPVWFCGMLWVETIGEAQGLAQSTRARILKRLSEVYIPREVNMQKEDIIVFDKYEWQVLAIQNDIALIVTKFIIEQRPYHDTYQDITWADCALRTYLNGEFYERFSKANQSRIVPVINQNLDNQLYGTKGGQDTQDRIFLLSLEEVCKYFGDSSANLNNPGINQRYWFERKDKNNSKRLAKLLGKEGYWWWWLRSPGRVPVKAVYIWGTDGGIGIQGNNILKGNISDGKCTGGIRPALWLKL